MLERELRGQSGGIQYSMSFVEFVVSSFHLIYSEVFAKHAVHFSAASGVCPFNKTPPTLPYLAAGYANGISTVKMWGCVLLTRLHPHCLIWQLVMQMG